MSAISLKSITGITSITTPAGVDDQLTLHNNNTTEAVKLDVAGNLHFHNHLSITGVSTASNFKTGTSNLHNTGLNVQDLDVDGHTNLDNVSIAGVTTFADNVYLPDSKLINLGDNNEFLIQHAGTHNYIEGGSGYSGNLFLRAKLNQDGVTIVSDGAVTLNHSGSAKLVTSSGGVGVTGDITVSGLVDGVDIASLNTTVGTKLANVVEDTSPQLGGDLYSNGRHIRMDNTKYVFLGTDGFGIAGYSPNQVYFEGNSTGQTIYIRPKLNQESIKAVPNGSVALHHSGSKKLETASNGVTVTGTLAATALTGDGSGITGITQTTINNNTDNYVVTATGTANTLQGEANLQWNGTSLTLEKNTNAYLNPDLNIYNSYNGGWAGGISFSGKYSGAKETQARIRVYGGNNGDDASLVFETGTPTEGFRIDSSQRVIIGSGSYSASNVTNYKLFIKESANENAAILFLDTDNMKGGICGATRGTDQLVTGTGNMDFVVGSLYSDTFIISGQSGNQNGAIRMKVEGTSGKVLIGPSAASEHGPQGNLDIVGDTNSNGPELYLRVSNNNTTDYIGALLFGNNVDKSVCMIRGATHTANNTGDIEFHTSNAGTMSEKFKISNTGQFTAQSESPALYGYYTSVNNQSNHVDFPQWTRDSFICLEIFGNVNPNSAGSGAYLDPVHMYVYRGIGWTGSRLGYYIYCVSVAPPARHAFPSGTGYSGNSQISAVWTDGSSNLGNETATSTNYMRLLIPNGNTSYNFPKQFRIFRRR